MMNDRLVLIVGAGPTGLVLAAFWLSKLGVRVRIIIIRFNERIAILKTKALARLYISNSGLCNGSGGDSHNRTAWLSPAAGLVDEPAHR